LLTPRPADPKQVTAFEHGRLEVEATALTLALSRFALAAVERLPAELQAADLLGKLLRRASPTTRRGRVGTFD